jgi:NDP-sugar pyrophosphorylase family protein
MHIIIPLSGSGIRFKEANYKDPKPLIKINNKMIIEYVIEQFDIKNDFFTFICSREHIKNTNMKQILLKLVPNCNVYEIEPHKLGPVYAVTKIFNYIINDNKGIIISYCDFGTIWNYENFKEYVKKEDLDGCIAYYTGFHPHLLGTDNYATMLDNNNILIEIKEKNRYKENKFDEKISNGCYYFKNSLVMKKYFNELITNKITCKDEYYVSLVYNLLVKDNLKVGLFQIDKMIQLGTPYDLEDFLYWVNYFNKKNQIEYKDTLNTTLILPLAGKSSRFKNFDLPKPFLEINKRPMFIEAVKQLPDTGNKIFICREDHQKEYNVSDIVSRYFDNSIIKTINYITEGQSCTVATCFNDNKTNLLNNPIFISACDCGLVYNSNKYQELLKDNSIDIIVFSSHNTKGTLLNPLAYAWLDIDNNNFIKKVYCKEYPFDNSPNNHYAITGSMFFRKGKYFYDNHKICIEKNIRVNGEFYVDTVLNECINNGLKVKMFCIDYYLNWGTPHDYNTYKYWSDYFQIQ